MRFILRFLPRILAQINGSYLEQPYKEGARPVYKNGDTDLFLYYHADRGSWCIGETIGSSAPFAYVDDQAESPGLAIEMKFKADFISRWQTK